MLYLILTVVCSVLLGFIFKLFGRYQVDGFQAIVFNYLTCFTCGWLHLGSFPVKTENFESPWMPYALVLGLIFISGFNMASILLTVPFAILAYHESAGWVKILGFLFALASIVLVNWPAKSKGAEASVIPAQNQPSKSMLWIPFATWAMAGLLEVLLVRVQNEGLTDMNDPTFIITIFGTAGVLGLLVAVVGWGTGRFQFSWKNLVAGIVLGIPNYGSMLFMLWALNSGLEGSFVFPVANVGIIVVTTIGAVTLFAEKLSPVNWMGIVLAVTAIGLITL